VTTDNIFGPLRGNADVEFAVLNTIETWLPTMLRVLERRHELPAGLLREPPGRNSYVGGLDFESTQADICPMVIVVVNPTGTAERNSASYGQWFEVEVGTIHIEDTEDEARVMAGHVGTAVMSAVLQHGSLGGLATRTELVSAPVVEFVDPDKRHFSRSRTTFHIFVDGLANESAGPSTPTPPDSPQHPADPDGPWTDFPTVVSTPVTLVAEPPE
jgi:hypothetical protein